MGLVVQAVSQNNSIISDDRNGRTRNCF